MTIRKLLGVLASGLMLAVVSSASAAAQGNANGCSFQGSYIGYNEFGAAWISVAAGQSASSGTYTVDLPGFDPTVGGYAPPGAVRVTTARGTWERVSGNTFAATFVGFGVDLNGQTVWIGKVNVTDTLSENCSVIEVKNSSLAVFGPFDNPFEDEPLFTVPLDDHFGYRMRTDPPAD